MNLITKLKARTLTTIFFFSQEHKRHTFGFRVILDFTKPKGFCDLAKMHVFPTIFRNKQQPKTHQFWVGPTTNNLLCDSEHITSSALTQFSLLYMEAIRIGSKQGKYSMLHLNNQWKRMIIMCSGEILYLCLYPTLTLTSFLDRPYNDGWIAKLQTLSLSEEFL